MTDFPLLAEREMNEDVIYPLVAEQARMTLKEALIARLQAINNMHAPEDFLAEVKTQISEAAIAGDWQRIDDLRELMLSLGSCYDYAQRL